MKKIKFRKHRFRPLNGYWVKLKILTYYLAGFGGVRMTVRFTTKSLYKTANVGGDNDKKDWFKLGGTGTVGNVLKKQRETLGVFRRYYDGERWRDYFEVALYKRPLSPNDPGHVIVGPIYHVALGQTFDLDVPLEYVIPLGAWAGGDGDLLIDFEFEMKLKPISWLKPLLR